MKAALSFIGFALACLLGTTALAQNTETNKKVSLLFVGDMVLDDLPGKAMEQGIDPYAAVAPLFQTADIRIGNLECVVATGGKAVEKNFTFRAHPRSLPVLKKYFDALSIANNHSGDYGPSAFAEMLHFFEENKIGHFGGGHNLAQAHRPFLIEKNGIKIALLGYDEFMPRSFEANLNTPGVAWSEDEHVIRDIKAAREIDRADIVIPFMHWGWENEMKAGKRQRELARLMIDAGADAVVGAHPHVIQDTEHYRGKPIIYSLGNFMMDAVDNEAQTLGWALRLHVSKAGVEAWDTQVSKIDPKTGIPSLLPDEKSPCWDKKSGQTSLCENRQLQSGIKR